MITIENVSIEGVSTTVPPKTINNIDLASIYGEDETKKLIASIGVETRHVVSDIMTSADLCYDAANRILDELKWERSSVGALIFVSQTAEYQLPATACILQAKLGLATSTIAYDVPLGCSGYAYGLFLASSIANSCGGRVLLLVGDTISRLVKPGDRSTEFLFGDAGSATAIEAKTGKTIRFELGTDGSGYGYIIAKEPKLPQPPFRGLKSAYLEMNGGEVFAFTLKRIPKLITNFLDNLSLTNNEIDACIYHQANLLIIRHLSKKSKFSSSQVPLSIADYGNTSGVSIPITLCSQNLEKRSNVLLVAFGVGLSWGMVFADFSDTLLLPVVKCSELM